MPRDRAFSIATRTPTGEFDEAQFYGDKEQLEDFIVNPLVEAYKRYLNTGNEKNDGEDKKINNV